MNKNKNLVENCLKAIDKAKKLKSLNMFVTETYDLALKQAENNYQNILKQNNPRQRLNGLIATVKDNLSTESILTTCGSKMLENYIPPFNATVVQKILDSGAIMLGKTNMDEFGMGSVSSSYYGTVKNPWNLVKKKILNDDSKDFYISGGSSGGSAATVATGVASFSLGSDTGGSIRNPASLCGCLGFKPTNGLVSRYGLIPLNNYLDTVGIIANSVETLVDVFNTIAGPDNKDATTIKDQFKEIKLYQDFKPNKILIGVPQEFHPNGLSQNNLHAWDKSLSIFAREGSSNVISVSTPNVLFSMSCYSVLTSCEVASNFARYDGLRYGHHTDIQHNQSNSYYLENLITKTRNESLGKVVKGRIVAGNYFLLKSNYEKYFKKSHQIKEMIVKDFQKLFEAQGVDLLITPTCFSDTLTYEEHLKQEKIFEEKDFFTACVNIAGLPALTLPVSLSSNLGLPVGVQLITRWNNEELLFNAANWFVKNNQINYPYLNYFENF